MPLDEEQLYMCRNNMGGGYLGRCGMKSCLENSHDGHVEEKQYPRVDVHRPIVAGIQVEVKGRRAVSWNDDVLQPKESKQEQWERSEATDR